MHMQTVRQQITLASTLTYSKVLILVVQLPAGTATKVLQTSLNSAFSVQRGVGKFLFGLRRN